MTNIKYLVKIVKPKKDWRNSTTHGRGTKGQKARKSGLPRPGFEGGQTPLHRRLPKRGKFKSFKSKEACYRIVNLKELQENKRIENGQTIDFSQKKLPTKILGEGEFTKQLTIIAADFSQSASEKITQAGGQAKLAGKHEK
jgi:large subunit ribosomal protein L15